MRVTPILFSQDGEKNKANMLKLLEAAAACEVSLEPQGFAYSWASDSTRVVVATEGDKPVGFGIMSFGRRWFDETPTASVLVAGGPARRDVLQFLLDMAGVLGAQKLFYEGDELGGEIAELRVVTVG